MLFCTFSLLSTEEICDMVGSNTIEVAEAMMLRELANGERSGGKSAEPAVQAWAVGGNGENISVTV